MHTLGEYLFDERRLIFYRKNCSVDQRLAINEKFPVTDCIEKQNQVLTRWQLNVSKSRPLINEIGLCLTYDCNLRCNYCSDSSVERNNDKLDKEMITAFITQAFKEKMIYKHIHGNNCSPLKVYFTGGGEPCYHWDKFVSAVECVEESAKKYSFDYSMGLTTNGMLTEEQVTYICEHFNTVMISYDGLPNIQKKNRCSPYGIDTNIGPTHTIQQLSKSNVKVTIRTTIWQDDIGYLREMADYIYDNYPLLHEWSIRPVLPAGRSYSRMINHSSLLKDADFYSAYIDVCDYINLRYKRTNISCPIFPFDVNVFSCGALSPLCDCPWLMPDGTIITCIEADQDRTEIGRVDGTTVVWNETIVDPLLDMYALKHSECVDCIAYRFCKGGCPVRHLRNSRVETGMSDWECDMIRKHITNMLYKVLSGDTSWGWHLEKMLIDDGLLEVFVLTK